MNNFELFRFTRRPDMKML